MSRQQPNLQDTFLNQARKENIPSTVYLVNGFQIRGLIRGFDNFTVALESEGKQMLVYKHAIPPSRLLVLLPTVRFLKLH